MSYDTVDRKDVTYVYNNVSCVTKNKPSPRLPPSPTDKNINFLRFPVPCDNKNTKVN